MKNVKDSNRYKRGSIVGEGGGGLKIRKILKWNKYYF